jgi:hypothetical protein
LKSKAIDLIFNLWILQSQKKHLIIPFLKGFASAFDISGQSFILMPDLDSGFQKDYEALKGDWEAVGNDLRHAMSTIANEQYKPASKTTTSVPSR